MFGFRAPGLEVDYRDVPGQKRLLREHMAGMGWLAPRMLDYLDIAEDFYFDQVAQVVMPSWSCRRVALLGDAAFCPSPMSGQGTGLALVGAYVLAGELATTGWDPAVGFVGYERRMRPFVEANQKLGRRGADEGPEPDAALLADAIHGLDLPDYEVPA
jgi:2-polyprenyl-6-methoxyphenol hydroxylase-like FAD-dependent oxidoreductase